MVQSYPVVGEELKFISYSLLALHKLLTMERLVWLVLACTGGWWPAVFRYNGSYKYAAAYSLLFDRFC